jgi:hypothetical protein
VAPQPLRVPRLAAAAVVLVAAVSVSAAGAAETAAASGATSRLEGTATRDRRNPVIGATASLTAEDAPSPLRLTATDDKGSFRFDGLRDGSYHLELHRDGFAPVVKQQVEVRTPYRAVLELTMVPGAGTAGPAVNRGSAAPEGVAAVRGVVLTRDEKPVPEARVRAARPDGTIDPRSVLTGTDGAFALPDLAVGPWRIEILGAGYLPVRADFELRQDVEIRAVLVGQPADYMPPPTDLLPIEVPIPPPGW